MYIYILEIVGCTDMGANLWGAVGVEKYPLSSLELHFQSYLDENRITMTSD